MNKKRKPDFKSAEMYAGFVAMKMLLAGASFEKVYAKVNAIMVDNGHEPLYTKEGKRAQNQNH